MQTNSASTPIEELVAQLVRPGSRVFQIEGDRSPRVMARLDKLATEFRFSVSPAIAPWGNAWDFVVAIDVFVRLVDEEQYAEAISNAFAALKPGGALIIYERNPYDEIEQNPEGTLARGILPIFTREDVSNLQVLGQEFFDHWCAAFWKNDAPLPDEEGSRMLVPAPLLIDRNGDDAAVGSPDGPTPVRILGWRERMKSALVVRR